MDEKAHWTHLYPSQISMLLADKYGVSVSKSVVVSLFQKHDYHRRRAQKKVTYKSVTFRDEQFKNIHQFRAEYAAKGNPTMSMDTKKKENRGNFYREGHLYVLEILNTYDHDFASYGEGVIIPHALYDQQLNKGYITLGTSKDTSEF
ncbi:ISAzo13 family transposase, partial [Deltaproteobacteria bacterium TL4]